MPRFEDVCAARLVFRQLPIATKAVQSELRALAREEAGSRARSLLARLVDRRVLTLEQAQWIHAGVERTKRARGLGLYLHLLEREGVARVELHRLLERLGPRADLDGLGRAVLEAGRLTEERERQVRFQARLALERDLAEQARASLAAVERPGGEALPGVPQPPPTSAGKRPAAGEDLLRPEEARTILRRTLSNADGDLPGPRFRIPDWVDMSDPRVGKQLSGWRILGRVGAGAMGVVYLADRRAEPERPVALKVLPRDATKEARARFKREILAQSFFSHPAVIDVYDAGESEAGDPWLAMEFLDGTDLEAVLADPSRPIPTRRAILMAAQVLSGLAAAHAAKVIHRDVKPGNVLATRDLSSAKLLDFGIAIVDDLGQFEDQVFRSMDGSVTGTPEYMSPEQAGGAPIGPASDVYSLGCVLYRALAGRLPYESETSRGFINCHLLEEPLPLGEAHPRTRALPPELHRLVARMLAKDAAKRPDARAAATKLRAIAQKVPERRQSGFSLWSLFRWR